MAAVTGGVEEIGLPSGTVRAGPGSVVLINPEVAHTARAGAPEGWAGHARTATGWTSQPKAPRPDREVSSAASPAEARART
ncbi:AraC family ligand binding domain-containing protein [Streptomyces sp. NPDC058874]|uniref:AraC family ligand binding domain-containing protein n=1 Tax=Streptomyces sp. NPDC058874 TaxID=3346662 RepID=UPI0036989DDC